MHGSDEEVLHRRLDSDGEEPATQIAQHIAELSDAEPSDLDGTRRHSDRVIDEIFENPVVPAAGLEVWFVTEATG